MQKLQATFESYSINQEREQPFPLVRSNYSLIRKMPSVVFSWIKIHAVFAINIRNWQLCFIVIGLTCLNSVAEWATLPSSGYKLKLQYEAKVLHTQMFYKAFVVVAL